jgi:ABC-2 type transport system permease protein
LTPIPASQQFAAVSWLRWRLFANGFRRKGGKGELVARILAYPFALAILLGVIAVAGVAGFYAFQSGHGKHLSVIFLGITLFQIVVSINIAAPTLNFDPAALIRYPLDFSRYVIVRLVLGLLSASTVVGTCALLSAATGVTLARPSLGVTAFAAALLLAATNMLFVRMVFIWVDRWLLTRRSREIFTGIIFVVSVVMQYLNVTFNSIGHHESRAARMAKWHAAQQLYEKTSSYLSFLPSGRAAAAVHAAQVGLSGRSLVDLLAVLLFGCVFLAVFGYRLRKEFRGENLSEGSVPNPTRPPVRLSTAELETSPILAFAAIAPAAEASPRASSFGIPFDVAACIQKEWLYIRRNTAQLYSTVAPLVMVLLFAGRLGSLGRTGYTFPIAVAYALLGTAALAYNSFGLDGSGVQFYFLAPVEMLSVVLAKNLFSFAINATQVVLVFFFISFTATPPTLPVLLSTVLWAVLAALINASVGNIRSLSAAVKLDPGKLQRRQASGLSALISLGLVFAVIGVGAALLFWARWSENPWLPVPFLVTFSSIAFAIYIKGLRRVDAVALRSRETLIENLVKVSN